MTLRSAGAALLKAGAAPVRDTDVTVLRANVVASGLDKGTFDWADPDEVVVLKGSVQPATRKARERAGVTTEEGEFAVYLEPVAGATTPDVALSPGYYRLRVGPQTYDIVGAAEWPSHTLCICEAL